MTIVTATGYLRFRSWNSAFCFWASMDRPNRIIWKGIFVVSKNKSSQGKLGTFFNFVSTNLLLLWLYNFGSGLFLVFHVKIFFKMVVLYGLYFHETVIIANVNCEGENTLQHSRFHELQSNFTNTNSPWFPPRTPSGRASRWPRPQRWAVLRESSWSGNTTGSGRCG